MVAVLKRHCEASSEIHIKKVLGGKVAVRGMVEGIIFTVYVYIS